MNDELRERLRKIRLIAFDVDGVLTDGRLYFSRDGDMMKVFHVHDGYGFERARLHGLMLAAITGMISEVTRSRLERLHIADIIEGCMEKGDALRSLCEDKGLSGEEVLYIGDDLFDIDAIEVAGVGVAVANAVEEVKASADYVTRLRGGDGAVREIIDLVIKVQTGEGKDEG